MFLGYNSLEYHEPYYLEEAPINHYQISRHQLFELNHLVKLGRPAVQHLRIDYF